MSLLDEAYNKHIPRYAFLCNEYDCAKVKATNARRKSQFLSRAKWQPPCGLSENKKLLQGPQSEIFHRTRILLSLNIHPQEKKLFLLQEHMNQVKAGTFDRGCNFSHVLVLHRQNLGLAKLQAFFHMSLEKNPMTW